MINNIDRAYLKVLALVTLEVYSLAEAAAVLRLDPTQVAAELASPGMQAAIDAEIMRLRFSGRLADLKLMVANERFADRLLAIDTSEMCATTAAKVTEIIAKTRQMTPIRKTEEEERAEKRAMDDHLLEMWRRCIRNGGGSHDNRE